MSLKSSPRKTCDFHVHATSSTANENDNTNNIKLFYSLVKSFKRTKTQKMKRQSEDSQRTIKKKTYKHLDEEQKFMLVTLYCECMKTYI